MGKYKVRVPIYGYAEVEVEASCEEEAKHRGWKKVEYVGENNKLNYMFKQILVDEKYGVTKDEINRVGMVNEITAL